MKLRLDKNSITIRIATEEREQLLIKEKLSEQIAIDPENYFDFEIVLKDNIETLHVSFSSHLLRVQLPKNRSVKWLTSGQVGIRESIKNFQGDDIILVVEEDLPPRKKRTEP